MHNFYQLYYHLVWSTKNREPLITAAVEELLRHYIPAKIYYLGCTCHQLGMTEDHLHLVATIPPNVAISTLVQRVKGGSAHFVNKSLVQEYLQWQNGYGVVSFSKQALPAIKAYAANQKEHHRAGTLMAALESPKAASPR
ncbi:MAG: hypothetical protein A2951_01690 [Candidatus Buchananbacteria bacterium RIFCSPLOWO2_01_FULL_56_15]|uniref:Transposase IS200-like domain-containing protein n=2 Tax=Candidatus Buchananiibacteriota TaxID=1817903 RepID=A0A1G1YJV1_9BACT|nr:MAG: hypothetical protein A3J59_03710 [Candidatus Buchananbacteria bacterium RIFCSPHIGHO2_02_FULL_56_16]OGY55283.1 MAG: hypothetical protein A2951_01690 [Candidatus Buchananbacteria bacterium RIFCSPLOWO2_01_FULL_56_15]